MVKVKLISEGNIIYELKKEKIVGWKSQLFEVLSTIDEHPLIADSDTLDWGYSDTNLLNNLPAQNQGISLLKLKLRYICLMCV